GDAAIVKAILHARVVLGQRDGRHEPLAVPVQLRVDAFHAGAPGHPHCKVDQVHAQVHHATAARLGDVVEPRLVGIAGVVKSQVDRINVTQFAGTDLFAQRCDTG